MQPVFSQGHFLSKMQDVLSRAGRDDIVNLAEVMNPRVSWLSSNETQLGGSFGFYSVVLETENGCWPCVQTIDCFSQIRTSDAPNAVTTSSARPLQVNARPRLTIIELTRSGEAVYKIGVHTRTIL